MPKQKTYPTVCKYCVFANYQDQTQISCDRNRLETFRKRGTPPVEAHDDEKEFFVIDRLCPDYRTQAWLGSLGESSDVDEMLESENVYSFHMVVFMHDNSKLNDVKRTVEFKDDERCPNQVTIIRPRKNMVRPTELHSFMDSVERPYRWRIQNQFQHPGRDFVIHQSLKTIKTNNFITINAGVKLPHRYIDTINDAIYKHSIYFALLYPDLDKDIFRGAVMPNPVERFWYAKGDPNLTVVDNVEEYQCQNPEKKIVWTMDEIQKAMNEF